MPRKRVPKTLSSDSSDDEPLSKKATKAKTKQVNDDSSSDSDIANYLQRADKIDLDSPFFNLQKDNQTSFDKIEKDILTGVSQLNGDDSSEDEEPAADETTPALNFQQLHEYAKKMEEVKRHAEEYKAMKQQEEKQMDVSKLLAVGETNRKQEEEGDFESCSEKEGWEEVTDEDEGRSLVPREGVQITVELPGAAKKKKSDDVMAAIKRRINRVRKENQVLVHKVHLLCWIAHGNYVSSVINSQSVLAVALSLLPSEKCYPADRTDLNYLEQVVKWYRNAVIVADKAVPKDQSLDKLLEAQITRKGAYNKKMFVYIFVAILRSLGIQCRLVLSFQVEPLRPPSSELCSLSTKNDGAGSSKNTKPKETKSTKTKNIETPKSLKPEVKQVKKAQSTIGGETSRSRLDGKPRFSSASDKVQPKPAKRKSENPKLPAKGKSKGTSVPQLDGANDNETVSKPNLKKLKAPTSSCSKDHPKRLKTKITKFKDTDSEDESRAPFGDKNSPRINLKKLEQSPGLHSRVNLKKLKETSSSKFFAKKPMDVREDIINLVKSRIKEQKQIDRSRMVKKKKRRSDFQSDEDSDCVPEAIKKKKADSDDELAPKVKVKRRVRVKPDEEETKKKQGMDVWVEVFLETEEKWISVDVVKGQVHCVKEIHTRATHPVSYIVAWNNNNSLKDVTRRYCPNFNTVTRKLRVDSKWWEATLRPFLAPKTAREREEDEDLARLQLDMPLPTSIAEYKNHPLYVLKRHLLKFQAIYPPEAPPLGFVKQEAVYARECVFTLHSREVWLKHAKVVRPGEKPYKLVKARARYDKLSQCRITDQELELFGPWQTEDYVPPTAEDGVVPRNAYGNVDLFKPCMLPKKTVHLQLPGLDKLAARMSIDCVPAVVGFDVHTAGSHPVFDGFVVCEEFAEILIAAWELEQDELAKKRREKVEKRVYGNWKRLIRGLLIRERLKAKYQFGESSSKGKKSAKLTSKEKKEP